jgi:hypothetical protein
LARSNKLPLHEFVDLYVHLRHPHHYDPPSWPIALWLSFLWPFPLAWLAFRRMTCTPTLRRTVRVALLICGVLLVAFLFAGVWYVSESLVQMSLFRFSIFLKLLTCVGAAVWVDWRTMPRPGSSREKPTAILILLWIPVLAAAIAALSWLPSRVVNLVGPPIGLFLALWLLASIFEWMEFERRERSPSLIHVTILGVAMALVAFAWSNDAIGLKFATVAGDPPDYLAVCDFARDHTPGDALFLVPPNEEEFRLVARRAIVVNFKGVPQLSSELGEWRDRLCRALDLPDLHPLPHRMDRTLASIGQRYQELSAAQLLQAARAYRARYVLTTRAIDFAPPAKLVFEKGTYRLYDLTP